MTNLNHSRILLVAISLSTLIAILGAAPVFGQTASDVTIVTGAGASASADCVGANNCFSPNPLTVAQGTTVTWTNNDHLSHTITSGLVSDSTSGSLFDSGLIKPGQTFQFTFANAGTYNYFCTVHPWMTGQVIVGGSTSTQTPQPTPVPPQQSPPIIPSGVDVVITQGAGSSASANCVSDNNCFLPNTLYINAGRTITWFNGDLLSHTITSGRVSDNNAGSLFDSGLIRSGGEFQFTFQNPGTYNYFCTVHPWMTAQVVVAGNIPTPQPTPPPSQQSPPTAPSGVDITISQGAGSSASASCVSYGNCFSPNPISIDQGRTITWFNGDLLSHTITSGRVSDNNAGSLFDSGLIRSGGEFRFTFQNAGTYNYFCTVHPWMIGQVIVTGSTPTPQPQPVTNLLLQVSTDKNSYSPGDTVTINTSASGSSQGQNIAVNVIDAIGSTVISRTVTTNDQNNANLQFKLSPSASTGTYQVIVTASSNGNSYKQSAQFTVQKPVAQISIVSVQATDQQGNPVTSFNRGANGFVKVVLSSQSSQSALTTVNLFGSDSTSIGLGSFKTTLGQGQSEMILSFYIPNNAATGTANIYADVDSDWPTKGGTPLTSESASTVEVQ